MQFEFYWLTNFLFRAMFCSGIAGRISTAAKLFPQLKIVVSALLIMFLTATVQAQKNDDYIFRDSSVMEPADDVKSPAIDTGLAVNSDAEAEDANIRVPPDSVLISNELFISADSINTIKAAKRFAYAQTLDSILKSMKTEQQGRDTVESNTPSKIERFFSATPTKLIFWTIANSMLLFILLKLFFTGGILQRKTTRSNVKVLTSEEEKFLNVSEYTSLIKQAIAAKDFRLATRYLYLQSLHQLIDKGMVTYAADKTNYEYLSELAGNPKREAFAALTLKYEYVWYGGFLVDETAFAAIQQSSAKFNNTL